MIHCLGMWSWCCRGAWTSVAMQSISISRSARSILLKCRTCEAGDHFMQGTVLCKLSCQYIRALSSHIWCKLLKQKVMKVTIIHFVSSFVFYHQVLALKKRLLCRMEMCTLHMYFSCCGKQNGSLSVQDLWFRKWVPGPQPGVCNCELFLEHNTSISDLLKLPPSKSNLQGFTLLKSI